MTAIPAEKLDKLVQRWTAIQSELNQGVDQASRVQLAKEFADLNPVVEAIVEYRKAEAEWNELITLTNDASADKELRELAQDELNQIDHRRGELLEELRVHLLPKDAADEKSAILEVRAGTGGDEAALFAGDLYNMYTHYARDHGWTVEDISFNPGEQGGYKEVVFSVRGDEAFQHLRYESGGHRVQRVPKTETQGRIHTSAATVAVMPEPDEVQIDVKDQDIEWERMRAGGAGGQHVNKTESAVRITHIPTGVAVAMQEEKSQHKNRAKAMKILKARMFEAERDRQASARAAERKGLVGSGDRSERIRTYNFPQGRVSDHRINLTLYKLDRIISGDDLGEIIDALVTEDQASRLAADDAE
jgi:peptide chain release factor 1